jgi:hypothetical protein
MHQARNGAVKEESGTLENYVHGRTHREVKKGTGVAAAGVAAVAAGAAAVAAKVCHFCIPPRAACYQGEQCVIYYY